MSKSINLTVPKGWSELSQQQLRFLYRQMVSVQSDLNNMRFRSEADYLVQMRAIIATRCFVEWSGLRIITDNAAGWLVAYKDETFTVDTETIAAAVSSLDWLKELPEQPVCLEVVDGKKAVPADLSEGVPFSSWLTCENYWQGYQMTQDPSHLNSMAGILYDKPGIKLSEAESLSIFYWWAGVKALFLRLFPHFFKPVGGVGSTPDYDSLRRNMDAQIRALTKGDATKEKEVLTLETWRALTELDAQAHEYEEINKRYGKKN